jgi:thymidylate synthase
MNKAFHGKMLNLEDFAIDGSDFIITDYEPLEAIKMPVAV